MITSNLYINISYRTHHLFGLFILVCLPISLKSQVIEENKSTADSTNTFLAVPLITNNPAIETGFGGVGMFFFKFDDNDKISPPSLAALYIIFSTNKSYMIAPVGRFFWNEDQNRASASVGTIRVNNDFQYEVQGNNIRLVYSEVRYIAALTYSRKIIEDFYLGLMYVGTQSNFLFDQGTDDQNDFAREFFRQNGIEDKFASSIGLNMTYDNRDYIYYPGNGSIFNLRPKLNASWLGSQNDFVEIDYRFSHYLSFQERQILAINLAGGFALGDVPFNGYQNYGVRNNLRGYEAGKYRGKNMITIQMEYRWQFYNRWGAVFFGGTGSVWGNDNNGEEEFTRDWLPSAGLGLRYMISESKKINLRLDYAFGVDGNQGFHFGVMEAF